MNYDNQKCASAKNRTKLYNNTCKKDYNCGGYALGTFDWYLPAESSEEYFDTIDILAYEDLDEALNMAVDNILAHFPELDLVSIDNIKKDKIDYKNNEVIAFRFETKGTHDFHFMRLGANHQWYEKCGNANYIFNHNYQYIFGMWNQCYDGEIVFFTRPRLK